jgi:hypothetical protein
VQWSSGGVTRHHARSLTSVVARARLQSSCAMKHTRHAHSSGPKTLMIQMRIKMTQCWHWTVSVYPNAVVSVAEVVVHLVYPCMTMARSQTAPNSLQNRASARSVTSRRVCRGSSSVLCPCLCFFRSRSPSLVCHNALRSVHVDSRASLHQYFCFLTVRGPQSS